MAGPNLSPILILPTIKRAARRRTSPQRTERLLQIFIPPAESYCALDQNNSRLAVPAGIPLNRFVVLALTIAFLTVDGDAPGLFCKYLAATPATCGDAIEAPLSVAVAVSLVFQADIMLDPGANISTTLPKFEDDDRASLIVDAPTVIASDTRAGEELAASRLEPPAAMV
jgi:hypothetical protein